MNIIAYLQKKYGLHPSTIVTKAMIQDELMLNDIELDLLLVHHNGLIEFREAIEIIERELG